MIHDTKLLRYRFTIRNVTKIIIFIALLTFSVLPQYSRADDINIPFRPGEKLIFELKWSFVPAGRAVLEVLPIETIDGIQVYHFVMTAKTNSFVDAFYKVRDKVDAYTDIGLTRTVLYKKKQYEGSTRRNVTVEFDWTNNKAQYLISDGIRDPISVLPRSFDPLAIFYRIRSLELEEGLEIEHPVTDGKKCVVGKAKIIKQEKIKLPCGEFDAYLLEPDLKHIGGVFRKSKNAKIKLWVTADDRRMPLKIKSKVAIGSFVGELVSAKGVSL